MAEKNKYTPGSTENPPYQWYCKELSVNYNPSASFAGCGHWKSKGTTPMPTQERPGLQVFLLGNMMVDKCRFGGAWHCPLDSHDG